MADATKYVSPQGSNSNSGNGPESANAYLTVTYALTQIAGTGNTIWVAPGTYEESVLTLPMSGASGAFNIIKGDPNCTKDWGSSVHPGPPNLSHASSGVPQVGNTLTADSYDYWELWDLWLDGVEPNATSGYFTVWGSGATGTHNTLRRCTVIGGAGAVGGWNIDRCFCIASLYGVQGVSLDPPGLTAKHSLIIGPNRAAMYIDCDACILITSGNAFGGVPAYPYCRAKNCVMIGGTAQYYAGDGCDNNLFLGCYYGYRGGTVGDGNILFCCEYDTHSTDGPFDLSSCREAYIYRASNATTPAGSAHTMLFRDAVSAIRMLGQALRPITFNDEDMADGTATSETYDILGVPWGVRWRGETSDKKKIGCWSLPDRELQYDATKKNIVKLYRTSAEVLSIPIKRSTATTISVQCDWSIDSGSTYPQIELIADGYTISDSTDTIESGDSQGHTLAVSVTASEITDKDVVARLLLKSRETTTSAYASFYGLTVT